MATHFLADLGLLRKGLFLAAPLAALATWAIGAHAGDEYTPTILVCAMHDMAECSRMSAEDIIRVPTAPASQSTCQMHGQAFLAQLSFSADRAGDRVKIVCERRAVAP